MYLCPDKESLKQAGGSASGVLATERTQEPLPVRRSALPLA